MPSGWDVIMWRKALAVLFAFSLVTLEPSNQISMHPLVHEWSRVRMSADQQSQAWKTAAATLARSAHPGITLAAQQQRRAMIPHIDAIMAHATGSLHAPGPDLKELSFTGLMFATIYAEDWQEDKVRRVVWLRPHSSSPWKVQPIDSVLGSKHNKIRLEIERVDSRSPRYLLYRPQIRNCRSYEAFLSIQRMHEI